LAKKFGKFGPSGKYQSGTAPYRKLCYLISIILAQFFLNIKSYNIQYLQAFLLARLIDDFMPFVVVSSAQSSVIDYFSIPKFICHLDGHPSPCFHTCFSLIHMTLLSCFLWKSGKMRFSGWKKSFSVLQIDLTSFLVWGLAVGT
jgi:hypothetical protein